MDDMYALFGDAVWVAPDLPCQTPYLRATITLPQPAKRAVLTICGLGFFEAWLNGTSVTDDRFIPLTTDYHPRPLPMALEGEIVDALSGEKRPHVFNEQTAHRILCPVYDVTDKLCAGLNVLGVALGPGYYNYGHITPYGDAKLIYRLQVWYDIDDMCTSFVSGPNVLWHQSPLVNSAFTLGEEWDMRLDTPDWLLPSAACEGWRRTCAVSVPPTRYLPQCSPADRVQEVLTPRLVRETPQGRLYDLGRNTAMRPLLQTAAPEGSRITVRFFEELAADGQPDENSCFDQMSSFITDGKPRTLSTRFTWNAFRYALVSGDAQLSGCEVIHSDVAVTSSFMSSDEVLNWLYGAYVNTQLSNMHGGIPSDCPHIERRGYTGDGQLTCEAAMLLLDARAFYRKWIDDISDCQDRLSGHVQYTAPYVPSGGGPGGWGCAIVEVPYTYWRVYGDIQPAKDMYPQMLRYFAYLEQHSEDGLVVSDEPGSWCLGDWCTAEEIRLPAPFVNTYFYIKSLGRVLDLARTLDMQQDIPMLYRLVRRHKDALIAHFYDPASGDFCGGPAQGAGAFAADIGMGDTRTWQHTLAHYQALGMYDTGIFGTDILTRVLFEKGQGDLAVQLLASRGKWSYGNWMRQGATTLWEYWTGKRSHDHPMFGAPVRYLFQYILGIRQAPDSCGYRKLRIYPLSLQCLRQAVGELQLPCGRVRVDCRQMDHAVQLRVTLQKAVADAALCWEEKEFPLHVGDNYFCLPLPQEA